MDYTNYPSSRSAALAVGAEHYYTGKPCKNGHRALRKTKGACVECLQIEWRRAAQTRSAYFEQYNRREKVKEAKHQWYLNNKEKVIAAANSTPSHLKKEYQKAWKERNATWVRADTKARRRKHREATPPWLTKVQKREMREIYKAAITTTKITGIQYVVDHIVPLRSELVCGLHVPWNLRITTHEENLKKSNKLDDGHACVALS
jgi:hypothetical protein